MRSIYRHPSLIRKAFVAVTKRWGTPSAKRRAWDEEYRAGKWTSDGSGVHSELRDPIYEFLERYSAGGTVLDLGCGSGLTALEMEPNFRNYIGVDVSEDAVQKARATLNQDAQRSNRIHFFAGDVFSFIPTGEFSVILFRESLYYIPVHRTASMLFRYSHYLTPGGVFLIRLCDRNRYHNIIKLLEASFAVTEFYAPEASKLAIIVCTAHREV